MSVSGIILLLLTDFLSVSACKNVPLTDKKSVTEAKSVPLTDKKSVSNSKMMPLTDKKSVSAKFPNYIIQKRLPTRDKYKQSLAGILLELSVRCS